MRLWDRSAAGVAALTRERENKRYLPGFVFPPALLPTADGAQAVTGAGCVVVAVPSGAVGEVLGHVRPHLPPGAVVVLAAKGMDSECRLPAEIALSLLGDGWPIVALSGPNLAGEVARGIPTAAVAACPDHDVAEQVARLFNRPAFRVYTSRDRLGVELGGAIKNVLAIAGGVSDGLGYGDNTKATLLTRGLAEMTRLGVACGADPATFYGLAGVGDLMATAASRLSRNWRVGEGLARGETLPDILARLGQVAEGVGTAHAAAALAARAGVEMPVCHAVSALLRGLTTPREAVAALLARPSRDEADAP